MALALAYLLVIQLFVAGFTSAGQAAPSGDAHAILCIGGVEKGTSGPVPPDHPDCCRLGCPMLGGPGLVPPLFQLAEQPFIRAATCLCIGDTPHRTLWRDPPRARGPPGMVEISRALLPVS